MRAVAVGIVAGFALLAAVSLASPVPIAPQKNAQLSPWVAHWYCAHTNGCTSGR